MRSDFDNFRAVFFDPAFSIATSHRNGVDFQSEKREKGRSKNTARQDTKACAWRTRKIRENTKAQRLRPQKYTRAFEGMIVDSGLDNTAFDMHSSVAVATTDG